VLGSLKHVGISSANALLGVIAIIAAITSATVNTISMRFINYFSPF
jgi:hypothetical protein